MSLSKRQKHQSYGGMYKPWQWNKMKVKGYGIWNKSLKRYSRGGPGQIVMGADLAKGNDRSVITMYKDGRFYKYLGDVKKASEEFDKAVKAMGRKMKVMSETLDKLKEQEQFNTRKKTIERLMRSGFVIPFTENEEKAWKRYMERLRAQYNEDKKSKP